MSDLTSKQIRKMDRFILKLIELFIKFRRKDQFLLRVDKIAMDKGEKKRFRVEIMEVF